MGGEEFVVLLPGVSLSAANETAQGIWSTVREAPIAKLPVTMSFGVCASASGEPFEYERIFEQVDSVEPLVEAGGASRSLTYLRVDRPAHPALGGEIEAAVRSVARSCRFRRSPFVL